MRHSDILHELKFLCKETGRFIRDHFRKISAEDIIAKEKNSLVSYVDREAEKSITDKLRIILPEAAFLTEEDSVQNRESPLQWIVDPLDGTTNFIAGIPHFSISIALKQEDAVVIGVVYNVMTDELYHAIRGQGAFLNDRPISVGRVEHLQDAVIATGFPYDKSRIDPRVQEWLLHYVTRARALRRLGSAALDLCLTAQGTFHLYYERFLNAWDIAAGILIVEEAGGTVYDFSGGRDFLAKGEIIALGKGLDEEVHYLIHH
jgi:myo-inositol-1(or 4)-monophosphatase